jgi:hypothetical protein
MLIFSRCGINPSFRTLPPGRILLPYYRIRKYSHIGASGFLQGWFADPEGNLIGIEKNRLPNPFAIHQERRNML